jgi:molybdopterin synthase sulfur carrier subunit
MKILYFARLRQIIGRGEDQLDVPACVTSVRELIEFLKERDASCAAAFADLRTVRAAVNQSHVGLDAPLAGAHEVAFFPPVTGG